MTLCVACLVSGTPCTLQYTSDIMQRVLDYTFSVSPMSTELAIAFFVMPLCTALSLNMLQMWLELYLKRIYAFMTAAVILLLATYLQNPLLPGVYAMVIRSSWVTEGGTLWQKGLLLDGMLFLVAVAGGLIWIRRYDMIPRE